MSKTMLPLLLTFSALPGCAPMAPERELPSHLVEGQPMYDVLPLDGIPAIDDPIFVAAEEAAAFMRDNEPVIGVVGTGGTAKCYSAWHLDGHEIVNDTVDGHPIAVTW